MSTAKDNTGSPASTQNGSAPVENNKRPRASLEERRAKIAKRKAALEKAEARPAAEARKERTGQLIAWGLWVEHYYQVASEKDRKTVEQMVCGYLEDRNQERAKAGFARVKAAKGNNEASA